MEELIQYLEQSVENVRGVDMVPLAVAIQAVQTASVTNLLGNLDTLMSDTYKQLDQLDEQ